MAVPGTVGGENTNPCESPMKKACVAGKGDTHDFGEGFCCKIQWILRRKAWKKT